MRIHALRDADDELVEGRITHDDDVVEVVADGFAVVVCGWEHDDMADVGAHEDGDTGKGHGGGINPIHRLEI